MPKHITILRDNPYGYIPGTPMLATNALADELIANHDAVISEERTAERMTPPDTQPPVFINVQVPASAPEKKKYKPRTPKSNSLTKINKSKS